MSNKYFGPDVSRVVSKLGLIFVLSLVFGWIYFKYYNNAHHWFFLQKTIKNEITYVNMVCYSMMMATTHGLGDIMPKSFECRSLTILQAILSYAIIIY
jgi:hypothetical protein